MAWGDKLEITRAALSEKPELAIAFSDAKGASEQFVESLRRELPFVDNAYLDFLRATDGVQIDMFVLFGSGGSEFTSLTEGTKRWGPLLEGTGWLPIGEDPSGGCIAITQEGRIVLLHLSMPEPNHAKEVAEGFSEFLDEILMGPRFVELFPGEWTNEHENEWTQHMREQGWM
jgi:hypothetical protein